MAADDTKIILRQEARTLNLDRYFTGRPCKRGHVDERYTSKATCVGCSREQVERWVAENPDGRKKIRQKWARANKDYHIRKSREWLVENRERARETLRKYRRANREKVNSFPSASSANKLKYRLINREKQSAYHKQWRAENPEIVKANHNKRRALVRGTCGSYNASDIKWIFKAQKGKCAYCRCKVGGSYHVDHIVPLVSGGTNDRRNIQITCARCNLRKGRKDPINFAQSQGMLL